MKSPLILSLGTIHPFPEDMTVQGIMSVTGSNMGNLLFSSSVQRIVANAQRQNSFAFRGASVMNRDVDGLVIAAANWLQPKSDFSGLCKNIEATDLPVVITGLGAQSMDEKVPDLQPSTLRLLKVLSERSKTLSVRGDFTAEVLDHYGIKNVDVTGCPSLLWHVTRPAAIRHRRSGDLPLAVSMNGTIPGQTVPKHANPRMVFARFLMQEALRLDIEFVTQTELPLQRFAKREAEEADFAYLDYIFDNTDRTQYGGWIDRRLKLFGIVGEWIANCAQHDLNFGTRLHGTIAGVLAGVPGLLITHDARTREMSRTAAIPHVASDDLLARGELDLEALMAIAEDGVEKFNRHQVDYYAGFKAFFDKNEVPTRLVATVPTAS